MQAQLSVNQDLSLKLINMFQAVCNSFWRLHWRHFIIKDRAPRIPINFTTAELKRLASQGFSSILSSFLKKKKKKAVSTTIKHVQHAPKDSLDWLSRGWEGKLLELVELRHHRFLFLRRHLSISRNQSSRLLAFPSRQGIILAKDLPSRLRRSYALIRSLVETVATWLVAMVTQHIYHQSLTLNWLCSWGTNTSDQASRSWYENKLLLGWCHMCKCVECVCVFVVQLQRKKKRLSDITSFSKYSRPPHTFCCWLLHILLECTRGRQQTLWPCLGTGR